MTNQLLILGILMDGEMHGYQLNDYVEHAMSLFANLKRATTYYVLYQLEKRGYVSNEMEREGKRPERRVYKITKEGKNHFYKLLRECISGYIPAHLSEDVGIAFLNKLDSSEIKELLKSKKQKISSELQKFNGINDHGGKLKYVISHRMAYLDSDLKWVDRILKEI